MTVNQISSEMTAPAPVAGKGLFTDGTENYWGTDGNQPCVKSAMDVGGTTRSVSTADGILKFAGTPGLDVSVGAITSPDTINVLFTLTSGPIPTGVVLPFASDTIPDSWLLCNGAVLSQAAYPALYAAIGSKYNGGGVPLGSFQLPDLRTKVAKGKSVSEDLGVTGGTATHTHAGHSNHTVTQPINHSDHAFTQPSAHSNHTFTQPSAHSDHIVTQASAHSDHSATATSQASAGTQGSGATANTLTQKGHTHNTPVLSHSAHTGANVDSHSAHTGGAVDAHSAHSGGAVDSHSAHSGTAVDAHSAHDTVNNESPYVIFNFIIKA
jgi:microcystin-dependent protein